MAQPTSSGPAFRRATPADAAAVRALTRSAYARWAPLIDREPAPMAADYERAVREHRIDLLCVDSRLVGLIETVERGDHMLIVNVAVAPACQGRGHGRRLLDHAERLAASLRLPEVRLYTNRRFTVNLEIYRRRGYAIDREEPFMGGLMVHMSKRIAVSCPLAQVAGSPLPHPLSRALAELIISMLTISMQVSWTIRIRASACCWSMWRGCCAATSTGAPSRLA